MLKHEKRSLNWISNIYSVDRSIPIPSKRIINENQLLMSAWTLNLSVDPCLYYSRLFIQCFVFGWQEIWRQRRWGDLAVQPQVLGGAQVSRLCQLEHWTSLVTLTRSTPLAPLVASALVYINMFIRVPVF